MADFVRTELDVGFTFLDIARSAPNPTHARRCLDIAIEALRTTDRFMTQIEVRDAEVHERRKRLRARILAITLERHTRERANDPPSAEAEANAHSG